MTTTGKRPGPRPGTASPRRTPPPPRWTVPAKPSHIVDIQAEVARGGDTMDDARTELRFDLEDLRPLHDWVNVFNSNTGQYAVPCPALAILRANTQWHYAIRQHGDHQFGLEKLDSPIYRIAHCYTTFEGDVLPIPPLDAYIGCTREEAFGADSYIGSTSITEWLAHQPNWTPPTHGC